MSNKTTLDQCLSKSKAELWRPLGLFTIYRLILALSMGIAFFYRFILSPFGSAFPKFFIFVITVYFIMIMVSIILLIWRIPAIEHQVHLAICVDIVGITLMMHASGGITSGLGLLIAISITIGSLLTGGNLALPFAALASLAVLGEQLYATFFNLFSTNASTYTQAGLLGITFFAVAMLAYGLAQQLRETERLAEQWGLDLANMAQVNEYIIQHMTTGVLVIDQDWIIRLINDTAWYLLGTPTAKVGDNLRRHAPELARQVDIWLHDLQGQLKTFKSRPGGRELKPQMVLLGLDQQSGILIFLEDSAKVLEQAQQIKLASLGRLTASIAHEIRNPLGAISHAGQLLEESPSINQGDRRLTEIIRSNSQRVNDVIDAVLQLSRRSRAHPEYVALDTWVMQFVEEFCCSRMLDSQYFEVRIVSPGIQIQTDTRQLTQVLENLCDNAIRYGKTTEQPTRIRLIGGQLSDVPWPVLEVEDDGPGISIEHMRQIFEPFFTTATSGTGLGLYIAKELCEINQIDLECMQSTNGHKGGCFRLSFHHWMAKT